MTTPHDSPSADSLSVCAWPVASNPASALRAGSLTVTVGQAADPAASVVVHRWFDESGVAALRRWPDHPAGRIPWVMWRVTERGDRLVTVGIDADSGDHLLAVASVTVDGVVVWQRSPDDSLRGTLVRGLVEGVAGVVSATPPDVGEGEAWATGERPPEPEEHAGRNSERPRSAHLVTAGGVLRALEAEPVRDPETDEVRARRAIVSDGAAPLQSLGTLVWAEGLRWWPSGRSPWIDAPETGDEVPIEVRELARALREATPPPAPPHDHH